MKKVLLTGAAGFIGYRTAKLFLENNIAVVGLDNLNAYYDIRLKRHRLELLQAYPLFSFMPVDIESLTHLENIFSAHQFDAVVNLAARAGVRYSMENPHVYLSTNTLGTLNLLEMMRKYGVQKMVLASTSSLYAGMAMPFVETADVRTPISPYAATKLGAEAMCHSYHKLYGIQTNVLRYFTVYGEAGRPDMSIFRFMKWIAEGKELILYGDGSQSRDFTYVGDIAQGTFNATKIDLGFQVINLGGGKSPISLNQVIEFIEKYLNKKANIKYKAFHQADMTETWANIDKAQNLLGWQPRTSLWEGLEKTLDWYVQNQEWLKDISTEEGNV